MPKIIKGMKFKGPKNSIWMVRATSGGFVFARMLKNNKLCTPDVFKKGIVRKNLLKRRR